MFIRNGKVRCVGYNRWEHAFTVGKVYEVRNNTITNDNGFIYSGYSSVMDYLSHWYKFEPVNEPCVCEFCGKPVEDIEHAWIDGKCVCDSCKEEHMIFCDCCGRAVLDENTTVIDGEYICNDCASEYYVECGCCGELVHCDNTYWTRGDGYVCCDCADDYYYRCNDCDELVHEDYVIWDEQTEEYYCPTCYEDRRTRVIHSYNYKPEPIFYGNGELPMGVELEIDGAGEDHEKAQKLLDIVNADCMHLYAKHDGSIDYGFELVSHPATLEYHTNSIAWNELMQSAVNMGYRSHDTDTCGLHIHVSRSALGDTFEKREETISKVLYFIENNWNSILRFTRRTERSMRRWADRYGIENTVEDTYKYAKDDYNRYRCLNLQNTNTIEFRMFRGTLNYNTFVATLQFVSVVCAICKESTVSRIEKMNWSEFVEFIDPVKFAKLVEYLKIRGLYDLNV